MSQIIPDIKLHNIAGRICYQLKRHAIMIPVRYPTGEVFVGCELLFERHLNNESATPGNLAALAQVKQAGRELEQLVQPIAGSTKMAVLDAMINHVKLPEDVDASVWCRLPSDALWIDWLDAKRDEAGGRVYLHTFGWNCQEKHLTQMQNIDARIKTAFHLMVFQSQKADRYVHNELGCKYYSVVVSPLLTIGITDDIHDICLLSGGAHALRCLDAYFDTDQSSLEHNHNLVRRFTRLLFMMNCVSNVDAVVAPVRRASRSERKYPKYEYRVLQLTRRASARSPALDEPLRQSPRQHMRRGHLRRLRDARYTKPYTWVSPAIVGDPEKGSIVKDYLL